MNITFPKSVKNSKGFAILEAIPVLLIVFTVGGAALGSWGLVHTAILNSIAARHNAFFILNQRSDITYRRDFGPPEYNLTPQSQENKFYYGKNQTRFFFIKSEKPGSPNRAATTRFVNFLEPGSANYEDRGNFVDQTGHNELGSGSKLRWRTKATHRVDPAWIMVGYGICLNMNCGS